MKLMLVISYLAIFLFGFRIFSENLDELSEKNHIRAASMTKIVAYFLFFMLIGLLFSKFSPIFVPLFCFFGLFISRSVVFFQCWHRNRALRVAIPKLLESILLQMTVGDSLRMAIESSLRRHPADVRDRYHYLLFATDHRTHLKSLDPRVRMFCAAIHRATQETFMAKKILLSLRQQLQVEDRFRNKISQTLTQIRVQMGLLGFLFFVALVYQLLRGDVGSNARVIGGSVLIYIVGLSLSLWLPKRFRWNL